MDWDLLLATILFVPVLYVSTVGCFVVGGCLISAWYGRLVSQDADQARVFADAHVGWAARVRGVVEETLWQSLATLTQTLYRFGLLRLPSGPLGGTPVVVLPGYTENPGTLWWLVRRLARAGFEPIAIEFPSTLDPIEDNAAFLAQRLREIRAARGGVEVAVVAHSMGGLVTRTLLLGDPGHGVRTLVAIASPFRGTLMARIGERVSGAASCKDMTPGSDYLRRHGPERVTGVPILSIVALQENIVCPAWSTVLPEAKHVVLPHAWGHEAPLFADETFRIIERWLRNPERV